MVCCNVTLTHSLSIVWCYVTHSLLSLYGMVCSNFTHLLSLTVWYPVMSLTHCHSLTLSLYSIVCVTHSHCSLYGIVWYAVRSLTLTHSLCMVWYGMVWYAVRSLTVTHSLCIVCCNVTHAVTSLTLTALCMV
jgi:hypothetical protein